MSFLGELIEKHGLHVLGEVATLVLAAVVSAFWIRALFQGRARPVICAACGRVASRGHSTCPRCGEPLVAG